jgi:phosphoglycerate dehydrogenase-like enzyme
VFKKEPYVPSTPEKDLRTLTGVLMTPHIGSSTQEACARMARAALRNIERAAQGRIQEMSLVG